MTWFPVAEPITLYDSDAYEAFPACVTTPAGTTIATWATGTNHYTTSVGRMARLPSGSNQWGPVATVEAGAVQFAVLGTRIAMLTMAANPYRGWVQISSDDGVTWGPKQPVGFQTIDAGVFPSGLAWVDDGTPDGKLFAVGYRGGVYISTSADAGATWTVQPKLTNDGTYNEAAIVQAANGDLLFLVRHEPAGEVPRFVQWRSTDLGVTWVSEGIVINGGKSTPLAALMPDGAILLPYRDATRNSSHSYAVTLDNGATWATTPLNTGLNMYAQFAPRSGGRAILVASTQSRTAQTEAYIWTQTFGIRTDMLIAYSTPTYTATDAPRLDLTITQIPAEASRLTVERLVDGQWWTVRTAGSILSGSSAYLEDHEAPVGVQTTYRVTAYNAAGAVLAQSSRVTDPLPDPPAGHVWISDPLAADSALLVLCTADTEVSRSLPMPVSDVFPLGSQFATTVYGTRTWGPILFVAEVPDEDTHRALHDLLDGDLLIRTAATRLLPPLIYGPPRDLEQVVDQIENGVRWALHSFAVVPSVGPGVSTILPRRVWADLVAEAPTWADVVAMYPTWKDALRGGAV